MSPAAYKRAITKLGMGQDASARFLGFSYATARRISRGDKAVPTAVALLLASMLEHDELPTVPPRHKKPI
jgi:hypothetical protein